MKFFRRRRFKPPVIAPSAIQAFLNRKLDDWKWVKDIPTKELKKALPSKLFETEPRDCQRSCVLIGLNESRFLFNLDMGAGKSKIALDLIRFIKRRGHLKRALIISPHLINVGSWALQCEEHAPDLSYVELLGSREVRMNIINGKDYDVYLINYDGLSVFMSERQSVKGKTKELLSSQNAIRFAKLFNMVIFDEIHNIGNHQSLWWRLCDVLSGLADYAYGLSGTPFGKNPDPLWPEFKVIDRGETLGKTLGLYRTAFYTPKEDYFAGIKWTFRKKMTKTLHRVIQHRSIRYDEEELIDYPKEIRYTIPATMGREQWVRYKELTGELKRTPDPAEREQAFLRCRQVTSGFIGARTEEGRRIEVEFDNGGKILALRQFLRDLPEDEKVVIFHEYTFAGAMIRRMLDKEKIKYLGVGHFFRKSDPRQSLKKFMSYPTHRVWLAQNVAGSEGVDGLQKVSHYCVFFESSTSPIIRNQAERRLKRSGQKKRTRIIDIVVPNTIDARILNSLDQGKDLFDAIVNGKEALS
jgi:SNF2 family DNA or RNA helicase